MRILFAAQHFNYFRNFESVLHELAGRGHEVHLLADEEEALGGRDLVERLAAEHRQITSGFSPSRESWRWTTLAGTIRFALEYVRFQDPRYEAMPKYRHRSGERAPNLLRWVFERRALNRPATRRAAASALSALERAIPTFEGLDVRLAEWQPDLVLLASVTNPGSPQLDHLKSAQALGVRTGAAIWSWDHLSGKAWLRIVPDRVLVWNEVQRQEAEELHGIPGDRVVVTGVQCYDQWFGRTPSRDRDTFCRTAGLAPGRPLLLYVCSVLVRPAASEAAFVSEWISRIRQSDDPRLREAGIVIRPHPERMREWEKIDLSAFENVAVRGRNPIDTDAKDEYFDSLYHADAVVGLVTSAFLEAAVAGRPVLTIQPEAFRLHQEGAPHFRYLVGEDGLLQTAGGFDEHLAQLGAVLREPELGRARTRRFVERFVRPFGLDTPATPRFVEAVEQLGALPAPAPVAFGALPARAAALLADAAIRVPGLRRVFLSQRRLSDEEAAEERSRRDEARKAQLSAERAARRAAGGRARAESLRQKDEARSRRRSGGPTRRERGRGR